jgi:hypothetical protein
MGSKTKLGGIIDHQNDAGGYEDYPEFIRSDEFDTDHDGLPDWWEELQGINPRSAQGDFSDSNADPDKDGYTALEDYMEWMSVPHFYLQEGVSDSIDMSAYTAGYVDPTYSSDSAIGFDLHISGSALIVTPESGTNGIVYLNINAIDSKGSAITRIIGICVGAMEPANIVIEKPVTVPGLKMELPCKVYPSMFNDQLNVEINSDRSLFVSVILYDLTGKPVLNRSFNIQPGANHHRFECPSTLTKQMYLLRIVDNSSREILKILRVIKI